MTRCPACSSDFIKVSRVRRGGKSLDVVGCGPCGHEIETRAVPPRPKPAKGWLKKFQSVQFLDLGRHSSWASGKVMFQLPPGHPDRIVTSERECRAVMRKHGIDEATGQFRSDALRHKAEGSRRERAKMAKGRVSISPDTFGRKLPKGA
jgi:hypothetical protein